MDIFDNIVVLVGCALIVIGLVLFIIGKKESANSNHVEGFGIKLNVSNPSIILIVLGVGLLLVPRLLPNPKLQQSSQASNQKTINRQGSIEIVQQSLEKQQPAQKPTIQAQVQSQQQDNTIETAAKKLVQQQAELNISTPTTKIYFPSGRWQLTGYQENSIDLSTNVGASLVFSKKSNVLYFWSSEFDFVDSLGNLIRYQYQGTTFFDSGSYYISFLSSNDPGFVGQDKVPLELKLENGEQLHMRYFFNNSDILLHWQKSF